MSFQRYFIPIYILKAKKEVINARLNFDSCKAKVNSAKPEQVAIFKAEVEAAESRLAAALEEARRFMTSVVENPDAIKGLSSFMASQLRYHKQCQEVLHGILLTKY